jgi:class 3 adenylate cyclase
MVAAAGKRVGRAAGRRAGLPSGTVTFLLTDIEASARNWQRSPSGMRQAIQRHDALVSDGITAHSGRALTERGEGDSFFAVFARASDALAAACYIQRALRAEPWPDGVTIKVRMALHTGEASGDYRGTVVNRCARLRALGGGGDVLVSTSVRELVRESLPEDVTLRDLGERRLRDLDHPERVFAVVDATLPGHGVMPHRATRRRWLIVAATVAAVAVAATAGVVVYAHRGSVVTPTRSGQPPSIADNYKRIVAAGRASDGLGSVYWTCDPYGRSGSRFDAAPCHEGMVKSQTALLEFRDQLTRTAVPAELQSLDGSLKAAITNIIDAETVMDRVLSSNDLARIEPTWEQLIRVSGDYNNRDNSPYAQLVINIEASP